MADPVAITGEALGAVQGDSFRALLPAEFQSKGYIKDINNFGDLLKRFDGAQTLLGQRQFPDPATATDTQWAEFFSKAGRPEKPELYVMPEVEGVPKEFIDGVDKMVGIRQLLHAMGANPYQAKAFLVPFIKQIYQGELLDKEAERKAAETRDASFNKYITDAFGQDRDKVKENGKKYLAGFVPDALKPLFEGLDDKGLLTILALTDSMVKKLTNSDPFRGGAGGSGGTAVTEESIRAQMAAIKGDPAYRDPFKDKAKHAELNGKLEVLRKQLSDLYASQGKK